MSYQIDGNDSMQVDDLDVDEAQENLDSIGRLCLCLIADYLRDMSSVLALASTCKAVRQSMRVYLQMYHPRNIELAAECDQFYADFHKLQKKQQQQQQQPGDKDASKDFVARKKHFQLTSAEIDDIKEMCKVKKNHFVLAELIRYLKRARNKKECDKLLFWAVDTANYYFVRTVCESLRYSHDHLPSNTSPKQLLQKLWNHLFVQNYCISWINPRTGQRSTSKRLCTTGFAVVPYLIQKFKITTQNHSYCAGNPSVCEKCRKRIDKLLVYIDHEFSCVPIAQTLFLRSLPLGRAIKMILHNKLAGQYIASDDQFIYDAISRNTDTRISPTFSHARVNPNFQYDLPTTTSSLFENDAAITPTANNNFAECFAYFLNQLSTITLPPECADYVERLTQFCMTLATNHRRRVWTGQIDSLSQTLRRLRALWNVRDNNAHMTLEQSEWCVFVNIDNNGSHITGHKKLVAPQTDLCDAQNVTMVVETSLQAKSRFKRSLRQDFAQAVAQMTKLCPNCKQLNVVIKGALGNHLFLDFGHLSEGNGSNVDKVYITSTGYSNLAGITVQRTQVRQLTVDLAAARFGGSMPLHINVNADTCNLVRCRSRNIKKSFVVCGYNGARFPCADIGGHGTMLRPNADQDCVWRQIREIEAVGLENTNNKEQ